MAAPMGDRREQVRSAAAAEVARWEKLLTDELMAMWARQEGVVVARLSGTKARKHTRHWSPAPAVEVKALDPSYVVDLIRWLLQAVGVVSELLRRLYEDVIVKVLRQIGFVYEEAAEASSRETPAADDRPRPVPPAVARRSADAAADRHNPPARNDTAGDLPAEARAAVAREAADTARAVTPAKEPARAADGREAVIPADVVEAHIRARVETVIAVVQDAVEEVRAVIADTDATDAPMDVIVDKVRDTYRTRAKTWTSKAVNASVVGAMNESSLIAATAAGVEKKQWLSSHDSRVRDSHKEADGTIAKIDEPFQLDGGPVAYPGDPTGPAGEVVNCRCTLLFPVPTAPVYDPAVFAKVLPVYNAKIGQLVMEPMSAEALS